MSHDNIGVLRCPFNRNHVIFKEKFQRHLVKCEKNFPPGYKIVCPYDATHRVGRDNIVDHVTTCPTRKVVEGSFIHLSHDGATSTECDSALPNETDSNDDYWKNDMGIVAGSLGAQRLKRMDQTNGPSVTDDLESRVHAMSGVGRDRKESNGNYYCGHYCSDAESVYKEADTEFVFGEMAIGRGRMLANDTKYHHRSSKFRGRRH